MLEWLIISAESNAIEVSNTLPNGQVRISAIVDARFSVIVDGVSA